MAWNANRFYSVFCSFLTASTIPLYSQNPNLQTSFLSPAAIHLSSTGVLASIETEHLPYLNQLAKDGNKGIAGFLPNASDLLIQKAEEKFRNGKRFYQLRDYDHARAE